MLPSYQPAAKNNRMASRTWFPVAGIEMCNRPELAVGALKRSQVQSQVATEMARHFNVGLLADARVLCKGEKYALQAWTIQTLRQERKPVRYGSPRCKLI